MALSETFSDEKVSRTKYAKSAARTRIPITARELVEWTFADQRAQGTPDIENYMGGNGCQTGAVVDRLIAFAQLGCDVDICSNAVNVWGETRCHEDALTMHFVVRGLPSQKHRELLIEHGRQRSMPDWSPKTFPLRCGPVDGARGAPRGLYLGSGRNLVGHEIAYEGDWPSREMAEDHRIAADAHKRLWSDPANWPVIRRRKPDRPAVVEHDWSPEPYRRCADEVLQRAREEYQQWYAALWSVCDALEAAGPRGLTRYRITALGAVYEPWRI